jgi:hypothetical protein
MSKREKAQQLAPWAAIIIALLGTVNAYIDSQAAKRKAVNEAEEAEEEAKEWTEERAKKAWQKMRERVNQADRERADLYYRLKLVERDLDKAIELVGTAPPRTGAARRDFEAKVHELKTRTRPKDARPSIEPPAPLGDWADVQREARPHELMMRTRPGE